VRRVALSRSSVTVGVHGHGGGRGSDHGGM
jgi:hypothetical protein